MEVTNGKRFYHLLPKVIDGHIGSENIADLYSSNFEQMYDSVGFDEDNMHLSKSRIYDPVINMCMHENYDNDDVHSCVVLIIFRNV